MMLAEQDAAPMLGVDMPFVPKSISYETSASIDDLGVMPTVGAPLLAQAKRTISLSADLGSEFGSVVRQFVAQLHAKLKLKSAPKGRFFLIVGPTASRAVQLTLAGILDDYRAHTEGPDPTTLSDGAKEVLEKFRTVTQAAAEDVLGQALSEAELRAFAARVHVLMLDVEPRRPHEAMALLLLNIQTDLPGALVWSHLISESLTRAKRRSRLDHDGVKTLLRPFGRGGAASTAAMQAQVAQLIEAPRSGRELICGTMEDTEETAYYLMEFKRFDDAGNKRLRFTGDQYVCKNDDGSDGLSGQVFARAATRDGPIRLIMPLLNREDREVIVMFNDSLLSHDDRDVAREWGEKARAVAGDPERLLCVHCGRAVGTPTIELVELDDEEHAHAVGPVHDDCLRPVDRSVGTVQVPFFEGREALRDFDLHAWIEALPTGQRMMASIRERGLDTARVAWNPDNISMGEYDWCVRLDTESSFVSHVHTRGRLHRLRKQEAHERAAELNSNIRLAADGGEPFVVSESSGDVGRRSQILKLQPSDTVHVCTGARAVRYSVEIARESNETGNYYAPLLYLVGRNDEEVVRLAGMLVLFSDPLKFPEQLRTLKQLFGSIPDYAVRILADDMAFNQFMLEEEPHPAVVIDPFLVNGGSGLDGIHVISRNWTIESSNAAEMVLEELTRAVTTTGSQQQSHSRTAGSRRRRRRRVDSTQSTRLRAEPVLESMSGHPVVVSGVGWAPCAWLVG